MPHVRKSIRDAIVAALANLTTTGARVFPGRNYPLEATELPALTVFTDDEEVEIGSIGVARLQNRTLEAIVEAHFKDAASLDDKADTILAEVETALGAGVSLGGAKYLQLARVEFERDGDGEQPAGLMRMTFKVFYITALGAPTTAL